MGEMFGPIIRQCELTLLRRGGGQSDSLSPDSEAMTEEEDHESKRSKSEGAEAGDEGGKDAGGCNGEVSR